MRGLLAALVFCLASGAAIAQSPADAMYTRAGALISAGTHRLNFYCMGSGSPTVILVITANLFHDTASTPAADRIQHMRVSYYEALAQSKLLELSSNAKQIFSDTGMIVQFEKPELVLQTIREVWEQSK